MRTKKIKIGFKDIGTAMEDFVETGEALTRGEHVREEAGVPSPASIAGYGQGLR